MFLHRRCFPFKLLPNIATMKHIVVLILAILTSISAFGQGDKELVLKILGDQQKCWNKADIDCFMEGYWKSDSLMFIGSKGLIFGWQATLERYKKSYPGKEAMGELEFDIKEIKRIADDGIFCGWNVSPYPNHR